MSAGRVLIVHPYRHVGGPDRFVTNLVRALAAVGWKFWVMVPEERSIAAALRDLGASVFVEPELQTLPRTASPIRLARYVSAIRTVGRSARAVVARHEITTIHGVHETMWPVLRATHAMPARRVLSVHGLRFATPAWAGYVNTRMVAAASDRIICVSAVVRALFLRWRVPEHKLALVPSSVDLEQFRDDVRGDRFRSEIGIPCDAPLIGTVGSVDERKGLSFFVEACARLSPRHPDARFVIVGCPSEQGPPAQRDYTTELKSQAQALGLNGRLTFVAARSNVPEVMAALDLLVQPSLTDAGPRAPLEAMAMNRAVVGSRVEGIAEEVVDGETGVLVEPRNSAALADAIEALLWDTSLRERMGKAGRARVEKLYSLKTTARLLQDVYRTTLGSQEP